ncbi:MAG: glycosyltransferase family 39 protein [Geminicoccaceae bacterium]|nr:glycosyltransferase family 39 protein [Geminicoccaceae bacterium]
MLLAIVLIGATLRLIGLGAEPLWLDEAFSWRWAHLPFAELWGAAARTETNPPLWFTIERAALLVVGDTEEALRLPAALAGIAAVPLGWAIGQCVAGPRAARFAALLVAIAPLQVAYAQEARGYAVLVFATLLAISGLVLFLRASNPEPFAPGRNFTGFRGPLEAQRWGLAAYVAGGLIAIYTHGTGIFLVFLANIVAFGWWLVPAGRSRSFAVAWLAANAPVAVGFLSWLPVLLEQAATAVNVAWIRQPSLPRAIVETARLYGPHFATGGALWAGVVLAVPLLLAAVMAVRSRGHGPVSLVLAAFAVGLPALVWSVGLLVRPLWVERVLLPSHAVGLVLAGVGLATIASARVRMGFLGLLLAIAAADLVAWHGRPQKVAWPEAIELVAAEARPGDVFLLAPHFYHWPFAYYASRKGLSAADIGVVTGPPPPIGAPSIAAVDRGVSLYEPHELEAVLAGRDRAWLFLYKRRGPSEVLATLSGLGRLEPRGVWRGLWDNGQLELFLLARD